MVKIKTFEDLECWQLCTELRRLISELLADFPKDEKFLLTDQMKRASRSVTNNIAEGYGRFHFQENIQFCRQSRGSLYELLDHTIIALDEKYVTQSEYDKVVEQINRSLAVLNGYINYLTRAKNNSNND
ncbi:S23 ribosomal [Fulvivirga imtechensis AK7]|uniref:S23 ribosomal n=1 Tax=Fulvivirga imtechensis AK7 TaxID=1237149 RepID=L8JP96_9BACT|nr:four helix bundle protein [Fulvivirga imtechensis]ELR70033.1 S23 ribosomal [Fulvivirga imtechensis AK7]